MSEIFADDPSPTNKTELPSTQMDVVTEDLESQKESTYVEEAVDESADEATYEPIPPQAEKNYPATSTPTKKGNSPASSFFHYSNVITIATLVAMFVAVLYGILSAAGAFDKNENNGAQDNFANDGGEILNVCAFQSDVGFDIRGDGSLLLRQFINAGDDTVTVELEYNDIGWIAMAFSESKSMVPNTAVIALPDDKTVQKFSLSSKTLSGVTPLDSSGQTLINATVTQENGRTIMKFTKKLTESDEVSVVKGTNDFNWAFGSSNTLGFHSARGSASLSFDQCLEQQGGNAPVAAPVVAATPAPVSTSSPVSAPTNAPIVPPTSAPILPPTSAPIYSSAYSTTAPIPAPVTYN